MQKEIGLVNFQDLITKFYYKQNHLCFQIILNVGDNETIPYKEFTNYAEYKVAFEQLSKMKRSKEGASNLTKNPLSGKAIYA